MHLRRKNKSEKKSCEYRGILTIRGMNKRGKTQMNKVLIIIPAYNEAENIERVVDKIVEEFRQYDYIIVNDGSTDDTRKICKNKGYNLLDLPVNVGLAGAIQAGMKYANFYGYEYVIQIDGDGQHMPEYIEPMLLKMKEVGCDIVIGSRYKVEKKPFTARMAGSRLITYAIYFTTRGKYIGDVTSGMRLFNKKMIKRMGYQINYSPEPDTLAYLINCGIEIEEVQVKMQERIAGESYLNLGNSIRYMTQMLFAILVFQWFRVRK